MMKAEIIVCQYCETTMNKITNLNQLPAIPYEWYTQEDTFFKDNSLYHCSACKIIYRKPHPFKTFFRKVKNLLKLAIYEEVDKKDASG